MRSVMWPRLGCRRGRRVSEGQARVVAEPHYLGEPSAYGGRGSCYIEFGSGRVGRVDVDFLSGPKPTGIYNEPSVELAAEKEHSARVAARAGSAAERQADAGRRVGLRQIDENGQMRWIDRSGEARGLMLSVSSIVHNYAPPRRELAWTWVSR